jgi:hypothetical protein
LGIKMAGQSVGFFKPLEFLFQGKLGLALALEALVAFEAVLPDALMGVRIIPVVVTQV